MGWFLAGLYYVVLKSLLSAILGGAVGWNKFERRGTALAEASVTNSPLVPAAPSLSHSLNP